MKKLIIFAMALFYFATNTSAQTVYELIKIGNDSVWVQKGEVIDVVTVIGEDYGHYNDYDKSPLMESYRNGSYLEKKPFPFYSCFGLVRQSVVCKHTLDRNRHLKSFFPEFGPKKFAWEMIHIGLVFSLFGFFVLYKPWSKSNKDKKDLGYVCLLILVVLCLLFLLVWLILFFSTVTNSPLPLLPVALLPAGLISGYFVKRYTREKK